MKHLSEADWQEVLSAAEAAGVPYFTRRKWLKRKSVPLRHWQTLIDASDGKLSVSIFLPEPEKQEAAAQ